MPTSGTKYRVTAREATGFKDYRRAGEAWPRGAGNYREVLVLDQAADPPGREIDGQFAIGQDTFAVLDADPHIFTDVRVGGEVRGDNEETAKLREENAGLRARVAELEELLDGLTKSSGGNDGDKTAPGTPAAKGAKK